MKAIGYRILLLFFLLNVCSHEKAFANGCTGSRFEVVYSPWCQCYQVCGNYISDCDDLVSVTFDFGDGTPSVTGGNPCHVYATPGTYTVTMTVVAYCHGFLNLFTTTCPITRQVVVSNTDAILTADFIADTTCLGSTTSFTNTTISAPGSQNNYTWYWGDGSPPGRGANPSHTYTTCGAYDVMMIATNSAPCCNLTGNDTIIKTVYVNCNPFDNSNGAGAPYIQESDATISTVSGSCAGDTTRFSVVANGPITNLLWTFPDSSTSTSLTPFYVYTACPPTVNYTYVNLTTNRGCSAIIDSITGIFCPSNIDLSSTMTLCTGQCSGTSTVSMTGGGTPPFTVQWNDPASQTTFTAFNLCPGSYNVTVTDGNGCRATPLTPVNVVDFPFPLVGTPTIIGNALCYGWAGGSALLTYTGGTPPYTTWWDNGATTFNVTGLTGGNHTVIGTDAHGCTVTNIVNIPEPPPVTGTVTGVNAGCNLCNGSATVNPTGGHGTYIYKWLTTTPQQQTQTATGLCSGVHLVVVEDSTVANCNDTLSVSISENGSTAVTAQPQNATCASICDGSAFANTGGCGACTYVWLDSTGTSIGQNTASAINLCSGTYTVQVTNGTGCQSFATAVIAVPNPIIPTATPSPNTCSGNCNGTIIGSGSGGNAPYTYQWYNSANQPIPGATNAMLTNACSGTYSVHVTDQMNCSVSATASVVNNQMITSATATAIRCNGDCNGMITVVTNGGTTPYSYLAQDAGGAVVYTGSSAIIPNLCAGNYTVAVTDAGNCSQTIPVSIGQPSPIAPAPGTTLPLCFGSCDGGVSVAVSGGTGAYTYEWRYANGPVLPGGAAPAVNNLCAGDYVLKVTDANNCATPYMSVALVNPALLTDSMEIIDPYCTGGQGSIDLTVIGGTGTKTFSWNNGAYNTEDISGLSSGTYTVVITDANSCTAKDTATFTQLPPLSLVMQATLYNGYHFKCAGSAQGEVFARVSGGLPPYTFLWNDSLNTTIDSIYGLRAGTYTVTVTDSHGCVNIDSIALNLIPPPFFVNDAHTDLTCPNANDGSAAITPSGGVPPYIYYWQHDTTQFNVPLTGVDSGTYIAVVYDANRCLIIDSVFINEPAPMLVSHTLTNVRCSGGNDGSIDLTVTGGTLPYGYSWNPGAYTTEDISALTAQQYIVNILDSNNCSIADTAVITQPAPMSTNIAVVNVTCFLGADGSLTLTPSNGTLPYSYSWNNGLYLTKDITGATAGHYVVQVTDGNNCSVADSADITQPNLLTGNRQVNVCANDSFLVAGAYQHTAGAYIDTITALNGCDSVLATNLVFDPLINASRQQGICANDSFFVGRAWQKSPGVYIDTVAASAGCDTILATTLSLIPPVTGSRNVSICISDSFFVGGAYQKTAGTYYDTLTASSSCDSVLATNLTLVNEFNSQFASTICYGERFFYNGNYYSASGTYSNMLQSRAGCDSLVTLTLSVLSDIGLYAAPDKAKLLVGESITVNILSNATAEIVSYTWSPNAGITCLDTLCEAAVLDPDVDTRYTVVAVDSSGCRDTVVVPILVAGPVIFIPNAFSPDHNGNNEFFEIYGNKEAIRFMEVKVFNRWGEKVYESNDLNFKWDGTYKGHALMPAVFVYTVKVVFANGKLGEKIYKGSVTLIK